MKIQIYDNPRLVDARDVHPGMILEALPGSWATAFKWRLKPSNEDPSNVFGYVIGRRELKTFESISDLNKIIVVRRFLPYNESDLMSLDITLLEVWSKNKKAPYLIVGEIKNANTRSLPKGYINDSISLVEDETLRLREEVYEFILSRGNREYVFNAPDGKTYSLNEILLNIREKS